MSIHPVIFAVCLLVAPFAALTFLVKRSRYRRWVRTCGKVIELVERETDQGDNHSVTFAPRVSFQTAAGEVREFVSSVSSIPSPSVGDTVGVLYNPNDPREATIEGLMFRHVGEFVVFSLSMAGVLVYVYQRFASS